MTYRSNRWTPTPPFQAFLAAVAVVLILLLLSGCTFLDRLRNPQPSFDPRIVLPPGQILEVNSSTHRVRSSGQRIEEFRCKDAPMMCSGSAVTMDCRCPQL